MTTPKLVTREEAAKLIRVTPAAISIWIKQGKLKPIYYSKRNYLLRESDVEKFIYRPHGLDAKSQHDLMTLEQVATTLGRSAEGAEEYIKINSIPKMYLKNNNRYYFVFRQDLEETLEKESQKFIWYGS